MPALTLSAPADQTVDACTFDDATDNLAAAQADLDANFDAWLAAHSIANAGVADQAGYGALSQYVDIPNLINYMLVNFYGGNKLSTTLADGSAIATSVPSRVKNCPRDRPRAPEALGLSWVYRCHFSICMGR